MKFLVDALKQRLSSAHAERERAQELLQIKSDELAHASAELRELSARQEDLIRQRTEELRRARDEAVAASSAKSAFLANMSHEIRTPLTSIIGFAELLLDPDASGNDPQDSVRTIIRNGRHLLDVINDILDLAKIETHQVDLEQIDVPLPELLRDIWELAAGRAEERALKFRIVPHLPLPATLRSDPVRLKQILLNFCSNAIKFTPRGAVTLELRYQASKKKLTFSVTDTGIGMTDAQMARLFQPFVQADVSTTRIFGGTGLGLYISHQLATLLGGAIKVESVSGQGSRFHLELPLVSEVAACDLLSAEEDFSDTGRAALAIAPISVPDLAGRVLLAEDGLDNQRLLSVYLKQAGLSVTIAKNGREAVETALQQEFELILMDIQMPIVDGVSATQTLRAAGYMRPIIALTANVMKADLQRYREAGCDDVLGKPIDRERFYQVITSHLGNAPPHPELDDPDYLREMAVLAKEFRAGLPAQIDSLRAALRTSDWATMRSLAHMLKGTAGSYGFGRLTELAADVESELKCGRIPRAAVLCEGLILEVRNALQEQELA